MNMQKSKRRNDLTHAQVNFSQSEKILFSRDGGFGLKFFVVTTGGGGS